MMFCKYCGKEIPDGSVCDCADAKSAAAKSADTSNAGGSANSVVMRIRSIFTDQLFLITMGLYLVSLLRYIRGGISTYSLILPVLVLIFFFQFYSKCKSGFDVLDTLPLKRFNVVLQIYFVLIIIAVIFLGIAALVSLSIDISELKEILIEYGYTEKDIVEGDKLIGFWVDLLNVSIDALFKVIGVILLVIAAWLFLYAMTLHKLKKFTMSVIETIKTGYPVVYPTKFLNVLLWILGIGMAIQAFTSDGIVEILGILAIAAVYILMTFIIKNLSNVISEIAQTKNEV